MHTNTIIVMQALDKDTRINIFLDSIGRNSKNTKRAYATGLAHFTTFLRPEKYTPETIIPLLITGNVVNVYELLDQFVSYLIRANISAKTIDLYMAAVRSFLEYFDVDIVPSKFRRRVKMPKVLSEPEEPLSLSDVRDLLEFCNNTRLTCYLLLLVSSGLRPMEAAALRVMDIDFSTSPTRITVRKEKTKTKRGRVVYCSDEATTHLQKLLKFRKNDLQPETLIFSIKKDAKASSTIYFKMLLQFEKLERIADKDQRKENSKRHKITLHSFRRTAFSIINEQTNSEYANWLLGHHHSVYWTHKEQERRNIYRTKCMPFLTIYQESRDDTIENALKEKDTEIQLLRRQIEIVRNDQQQVRKLLSSDAFKKKLLEKG